jgi:protein SCO1/2
MPRQQQYAHPGVIMLLTPDGRVARYLYGIEYDANDMRIGLLEASEGRSISTVERVLLYCYRYDASEQKYVVMAWRVMQIGGGLTALLIGGMLAFFWRRELRKRRVPGANNPRSLDEASRASGERAEGRAADLGVRS